MTTTNPDAQGTTQLVRYDIAADETHVLQTFHEQAQAGAVFWLDNGRYIVVQTINVGLTPHSPQRIQAVRVTADGTTVDQASADWARLQGVDGSGYVPLTTDNQLITIADEGFGQINVRAIPFRAGDTPRFPPVWLPDNNESRACEVVYLPLK